MVNLKKILLVLLIAILMLGVSNIVLATEVDENITFIPDEGGNNSANTNTSNNGTTNTNDLFNNTNTINNAVTNNTNSSQYNNTGLPKAGSIDNTAIIVIVAVFGISALYAYKKIRDYNIK